MSNRSDAAARHVVIMGGGMSGLTTAIAASRAGARVTVLEAADDPGGSMRLSGGLVWAPRDLATARRYIPKGDAELQAVLVDRSVHELPRVREREAAAPFGQPALHRLEAKSKRLQRLDRAHDVLA